MTRHTLGWRLGRLVSPLVVALSCAVVTSVALAQRPAPAIFVEFDGEAHADSTRNLDRGVAVDGPLAGRTLERISVTTAFWFAWSSFYPNTEVAE
jgi:hypothetical protein